MLKQSLILMPMLLYSVNASALVKNTKEIHLSKIEAEPAFKKGIKLIEAGDLEDLVPFIASLNIHKNRRANEIIEYLLVRAIEEHKSNEIKKLLAENLAACGAETYNVKKRLSSPSMLFVKGDAFSVRAYLTQLKTDFTHHVAEPAAPLIARIVNTWGRIARIYSTEISSELTISPLDAIVLNPTKSAHEPAGTAWKIDRMERLTLLVDNGGAISRPFLIDFKALRDELPMAEKLPAQDGNCRILIGRLVTKADQYLTRVDINDLY